MVAMLAANGALALGRSCSGCVARERCYRSPHTRAQAVGEAQNWMDVTPVNGGPCAEWWAVKEKLVLEQSCYITADQIDEFREQGWRIEPPAHRSNGAELWMAKRGMP
jgi:hypothetical protein